MLYFDRETLKILRTIKKRKKKGITWGELLSKFDDEATHIILILFTREQYIGTRNEKGEWLYFEDDEKPWISDDNFTSFSSPKGNELVERCCFDFWKWIIPTIISIIALAVSALSS